MDVVLRAQRVVTPGGERPAAIGVRDGRIVAVGRIDEPWHAAREVLVAPDHVVLPGLVDTHVHLQEGNADWEGFDSGTRAAALGGVTTVVDMPLDGLPVTVDLPALQAKRAAAQGRLHVDVGLWAGVTPANLHLLPALADAGVAGFKCFLTDTGLDAFPAITPDVLTPALATCTRLDRPLLVHAEDAALLAAAPPAGTSYAAFLAARPPAVEDVAVAAVIAAARTTGGHAHVVHVSSASAADLVAAARADGVRVTAETCPHYLTLASEQVPDADPRFKVCPPVRDAANRERLWEHLAAGTLDCVVSDHSPCGAQLKHLDDGDLDAAFGGIASLQHALPLLWTAARERGFSLADVARWAAAAPARLAGLTTKGAIAPGRDADLCVVDPDAEVVVDPQRWQQRQRVSPYAGRRLRGAVVSTWLRGEPVDADRPSGRLLDHP